MISHPKSPIFTSDTHQRLPDATHDRAVGEVAWPETGFSVVDQIGHFRHFWRPRKCESLKNWIIMIQGSDLGEHDWLVVSTHLKNISQNGNLPQIGVKIKSI